MEQAFTLLRGHRSVVNHVRYGELSNMLISCGVEKIIKVGVLPSFLEKLNWQVSVWFLHWFLLGTQVAIPLKPLFSKFNVLIFGI